MTSPFLGLLDLYQIHELPISDTPHAPKDVEIFEVDTRIAGASVAPADITISISSSYMGTSQPSSGDCNMTMYQRCFPPAPSTNPFWT